MRTTATLLLFAAPFLMQAQVPGDTLVMDFDNGATLVLDSVYPAGCWQVGVPNKPVFTSALSLPNALVTDTVQPYPENSTCYAEYTLITDESMGYYGRWIEFDNWLDIDPTSQAWLEVAEPWSGAWHRFGSFGDDGWMMGNVIQSAQGFEFDPAMGGWQHVILDSPCIGVMDGGNERWYNPIMRLRFVFTSLDNPDARDGWMIDNVRATVTICTGGVPESAIASMTAYPVPAAEMVRLTFGAPIGDAALDVIGADGRIVLTRRVNGVSSVPLDVSGLENGWYMCRLGGSDRPRSSMIIVQH